MDRKSIISRLQAGLGIGPKPKPVKLEELLPTLFPGGNAEIWPKDGPHFMVELKWSFDPIHTTMKAAVSFSLGEEALVLRLAQDKEVLSDVWGKLEDAHGKGGITLNIDVSIALRDKGFLVDTLTHGQVTFRTPNSEKS